MNCNGGNVIDVELRCGAAQRAELSLIGIQRLQWHRTLTVEDDMKEHSRGATASITIMVWFLRVAVNHTPKF